MSEPVQLPPRVRVARLVGVLALIFATTALLIWLLLWLAPPGPACVVIAGAGYEDNLALQPNPQGREAMFRLARLAGTSSPLSWLFQRSGKLRLAHPPLEVNRGTDWWRGLEDAREQTFLIFLALNGGTDGQGAYLLPHNASDDPADRLRLDDILDRLAELPPERHKLLLLDATALGTAWSLGLLHNDFATALENLEPRIAAIPNLVVLASSGVNQHSWPAADLRLTLFTQRLFQGLIGAADADTNGQLHAWELFQYLSREVTDDARRLHNVHQTPILLPRADGETRARAINLTFQLDPSQLEGDPIGQPLDDIRAAWDTYETFRPLAAAARACVPGEWLLWQTWLLRYEYLRMSGSPFAPRAAEEIRQAGIRVRQGLDLQLVSGSLSLAMPAVQGETRLGVPDSYPPMEQLWQANVADRRATWLRLRANDPDGLLRRNILVALLRRAAENPARNLEHAAQLVKLLDDPVSVIRPAEAHFLVLLDRDLPVRPIPEPLNFALADALRCRLLAEEAALAVPPAGYAYAERILRWIHNTILQADHLRQQGEDLLFASDPVRWAEARQLLRKATTSYQQAAEAGAGFRLALAVCDRGAMELPFHAHWVAALSDDPDDSLLRLTMSLFEQIRQLEHFTQTVLDHHDAERLNAIRQQAQTAQDGLDHLQTRLDAFAQTCETSLASPWRDGGFALRVPWLAADQRSRLLQKLSRLAQQARSESEAGMPLSPEQLNQIVQRRAVREGRLALAALGQSWFDESRRSGMTYGDVEPFVRRPDLEGVWSRVLRWAGDQIGDRFRQYPPEVERLTREARRLNQVAGPLRQAARLQRRFDAGQWQASRVNAPLLARRANVEELLVWQASRALADHWYNDDPAATPYYRIAGTDFLRDARRLDPFDRANAPGVDALTKQLDAPDGLSIAPLPADPMIAGDRLRIQASLSAKNKISGSPLLWAEPGERLAPARPDDRYRTVVSVNDASATDRRSVLLASPQLDLDEQDPPLDAQPRTSSVVWRAYYRGQMPRASVPITLYPVPESTRHTYPPPPRAGIALHADQSLFARYGEARGGLVLVVDCSGSVGPPPGMGTTNEPAAADARARFRQTVESLRKVLTQVPRGTRLSLWIFGQAVPPRNTTPRAEDTIQRLRDPSRWNATRDEVDSLVAQVAALEPWNESPIARALLRAREDLVKVDGFRSMILLSDGDDNRFASDREANPHKESIPDVLRRRLADAGITLHVVGFAGKDGQPEAPLVSNFGFVSTLTPPGTLSTVTRSEPLLAALRLSMPAGLRYSFSAVDDRDASPELIEVSRPAENNRWNLTTGSRTPEAYRLRVPQLNFDRRLTLRPGDFALLNLDSDSPGWHRLTWSRLDAFALRPARQAGGWRTAIIQQQLLGERALQMLVSFEKESPRPADPGQFHPGALWLELTPAASNARPALRWAEVFGYPAPAWGIDAPGWPVGNDGPPAPRFRAWWANPSEKSSLLLRQPHDFSNLERLLGPRVVAGTACTIERAALETHWVQVRSGRREKRCCLVLGISHPLHQPIWAYLDDLAPIAGQEHRHFLAAGRYVGLFWFDDAPDEDSLRRKLDRDLRQFRLISVAAFQKEAQAQLQHVDFADLDSPAPLPPRPRPVWTTP